MAGGAELHLTSPGVDRTRQRAAGSPTDPPHRAGPDTRARSRAAHRSGRPPDGHRRGAQSSAWPWALLGIFLLAAGAAGGYLVVQAINDTGSTGSGSGRE